MIGIGLGSGGTRLLVGILGTERPGVDRVVPLGGVVRRRIGV